ncbi:MAG: MMPL family transporter [Deltaproteobacteria bacterium]|nr:MMPL family transporter [Deltaproteobacteria bacterium]
MDIDKLRKSPLLFRIMRRAAWPIIIFSLLTAALSVFYSYKNLRFSTSRSELVGSDQRLMRLSQEYERQFGDRDQFVVVVENGKPARSIRFAEALAQELRKHPGHFPQLFYRVDPEPFKKWALLYPDVDELQELKSKLLEHRQILASIAAEPSLARFFQVVNQEITRAMIGELFTSFLKEDEEKEPIPDLSLLNGTLEQLNRYLAGETSYVSPLNRVFPGDFGDFAQEGYFFTDNKKYLLFLVTTHEDGYITSAKALELLRQIVDQVKTRFPGISVGVTGPAALSDDEMTGAMADINLASWLSLFAQTLIMVIFFWSIKRPLVQGLVLLLGLCWSMGLATLVVGSLNILSIVFAPLLLGITVDFGIHWYSRLEEEEGGRPYCTEGIFTRTMIGATPGNFYAALVAILSILPLVFTGFKGLAELGLIVAMGIGVMIFGSIVLLPALALVTEKCQPDAEVNNYDYKPAEPRPFMSLQWRRPGFIVAAGVVILILGGVALKFVPFDLNPLHLQNQETESVIWELKILKESRYSSAYGTMVAVDLEDLPTKVKALKALPTVSHCESILSFLPENVPAKQAIIQELAPVVRRIEFASNPNSPTKPGELAEILGRIRFKLSEAKESDWQPESKPTQEQLDEANLLLSQVIPRLNPGAPEVSSRLRAFEVRFFDDLREKWDLLKANVASKSTPQIEDLPYSVRERFISAQDTYLIRVFSSIDIWETEPLGRFVNDLRTVDPNVAGDPVLLYHFNFAFRNSILWAAGVAILAIAVMLWLLLRSVTMTILALIPLFVGTALTLILMWLLGIPFNQANVLFVPLILGEGIEYGIVILVRWQLEESARAITLPASTAKGVALAALTTAFGFGSMMISGHRGTFSLGLLSTVGALSVLLAALIVLPAFLRLVYREEAPPQPALASVVGVRRWLDQILRG